MMSYAIVIQNDAILNNYIHLLQRLSKENKIYLLVEKNVVKTIDLIALQSITMYE